MPTAGPHTEAITGLGRRPGGAGKRNTGESCVAGAAAKVANVVARAEDGHVALEHHHAHAGVLLSSGGASAMAAYIVVVMGFLVTRLKVMVVTGFGVDEGCLWWFRSWSKR